jgi:Domain of unknown function (DUF4276)
VKRVLILVAGQTEETFARDILAPHLSNSGVYLKSTLVKTKHVEGRPEFKGGVVPYGRLRKDILRLLGDTNAAMVTTMLDFYGLPRSFPGRDRMPAVDCYQRAAFIEDRFREDINDSRFLPYLMLHEFEAMMFVSPEQIAEVFRGTNVRDELLAIKTSFKTPEEIDDNPISCPSKRILALLPQYRKAFHGPLVTSKIGIDRIRSECPHFNRWLAELEALD